MKNKGGKSTRFNIESNGRLFFERKGKKNVNYCKKNMSNKNTTNTNNNINSKNNNNTCAIISIPRTLFIIVVFPAPSKPRQTTFMCMCVCVVLILLLYTILYYTIHTRIEDGFPPILPKKWALNLFKHPYFQKKEYILINYYY